MAREGRNFVDRNAFAERAERMKTRLYRTAFLYLGSEAFALDAVDEAVYRGFLSVKKLREPEFFETWMTRILINECKKMLRRRKREISTEIPELESECIVEESAFDALPLKEAIRVLPVELREVIVLRYFSDFTLAETAKCLDIPQGTVVTRQRRALKLLKLELNA